MDIQKSPETDSFESWEKAWITAAEIAETAEINGNGWAGLKIHAFSGKIFLMFF
jgi:hypothetical protein